MHTSRYDFSLQSAHDLKLSFLKIARSLAFLVVSQEGRHARLESVVVLILVQIRLKGDTDPLVFQLLFGRCPTESDKVAVPKDWVGQLVHPGFAFGIAGIAAAKGAFRIRLRKVPGVQQTVPHYLGDYVR